MGEQQPVDEQGNTLVLSLERKSVQPFKTQDEYLYAMKEDLAEWLNTLYSLSISVGDFFEQLETGVVICQHANRVQDFILEKLQAENASFFHARPLNVNLPEKGVQYRANVREGSFQSRDNISNFITWCRGLGIPDCLLFETDDLVMRKNERNVVLCLLELARRGAKYGMQAPLLIQLEEEIDAEIDAEKAGEEFTPPPKKTPPVQRRMIDLMSLDEMVRHIVSICTCPDQFPIIRVAEGKYKIGEALTLIFVRILRNHVMVRIGGGWDTLENYLDRHDPCRCKSGHKGSRSVSQQAASQVQAKRRGSAPSASLVGLELKTKTVEKAATQEKTKITSEPSSPTRRVSLATSSPSKNMQRSLPRGGRDSSTARADNAIPTRQLHERRRSIPTLHKTYSSATDLSQSAEYSLPLSSGKVRPSSARPSSARPSSARTSSVRSNISRPSSARESSRRLSSTAPATDVNDLRGRVTDTSRGRSRDKDSADAARQRRSRSIGAPEMRRQLNKTASTPQFNSNNAKDNSVLYIQRDGSGRHRVGGPVLNGSTNNSDSTRRPNTLNSTRMNMSPSKILPNKMKGFPRSQSMDTTSPTSPLDQNGKPIFSLGPDFDDLPDPEADVEANKRMELLFEEYRKIELGLSVDLPGQVSDSTPENDTNANPQTASKGRKKSVGKHPSTPSMSSVSRSSSQRKPSTGVKSHSRTSSGGYTPTTSAGWRKERTPSPCPFDNGMSSGRSTPSSYYSNGRLTSTSSDVSLDMMSLSSASDKNTTRGRFGSTSSEAASEASDISQRPKSGRSTPRSAASTPRSTPVPRSKTPTPGRQRKISASNSITPQASPTPQRKTYSPRSKSPSPRTSTRQRTTGRVSQESLGLHSSRATPPSRSRSPSPRGDSPLLQTQVPPSRSRSPSPRLIAEQPSGIPISRSRSPSPHYSPRNSRDQQVLHQSSIPVSRSRSPSPRPSPRQPLTRSASPSPRASPVPRGKIPTVRSSSPSPRQSPKRTPTAQQSPRPQRKASGIAAPAATTKPKIDVPIVTKTCWANAPWRSNSSSTSSSFVSCVSNIEQTGETSPEREQPEKSSSFQSKTSFSLTAPATGSTSKPARTENKSKLSKTGASPTKLHQKTKSVDRKSEQTDVTDTEGITKNEMSVKITPMIYTPGKPPQPAKEDIPKVANKVAVSYDGAWDSNDNPSSTPVQPQIKKPVQKQQTKKVLQDQKRNNSMDKQDSKTESKTPQRRAGVSYPRSQSAVRSASITRMRAVNQDDSVDVRRPMSARGRSQSKENILDSNSCGGRRSRMDQHNADRDTKRGRLSRADAVDSGPPPPASLAKHHRSKSTTCLAPKTVPQLTIQVDEASVQQFQDELDKINAKPRRDDRVGPRSRIPMPVDVKRRLQKEGGDTVGATDLKRFDSGVDINNFSPTDNSMQGEDEQNMTWQQPEAVEVAAFTQSRDTQLDTDDYF